MENVEMNKLEKRDSIKYTRIEKLKPYEYINSVAYEFYMRKQNKESEITYEETNGYIFHPITCKDIKITDKVTLKDLIYNIFPSLYQDLANQIKEKEPDILDERLEEIIKNKEIGINSIIQNYIKNDTIKFNEIFYENNDKIEKLTKKNLIKIIDETSFAPLVIPNFSVPPVYQKYHKYVTLSLVNLELPEKDLIEYIKRIKKDYDYNKLKIDMPVDLIHDNYKENNATYTQKEYEEKKYKEIKIKKKNGTIIKKSSKIVFDSPSKVADLLYIYDNSKKKISMAKIRQSLSQHQDCEFTYDTYYFYEAVSKEFIDNYGYLKLVSKPL